ncbi:MAG: aromatic ring-hydroxylating dioxygenase subunit alpha [Rhodospirillales bacterium]|nr:aromatic ring-hydroxylating dioxygenase subunit alpha [Rhodospirillales bacterium]
MTKKLKGNEDFAGLSRAEKTLPSLAYYDPAYFRQELENIWFKDWVYLCRSSSLEGPRAYRTFTIADQGILLLRDGDGVLQAFHNTCRHRGSVLRKDEAGRFNAKLIICPYHQWSFSMQGDLVRTTSLSEASDFCKEDYPLYRVAMTEWRGCVFVSLAEDPEPFEAAFRDELPILSNWPLEDLVVGHHWQKTMTCNWKTFWENYMECLHCPDVHPELTALMPMAGRRINAMKDDPNWKDYEGSTDPALVGGLREGAETWTFDGKAAKHRFDDLSDTQRDSGQTFMTLLPTIYVAAHVDYVRIVRLMPLGPEETEIQAEWLFPEETLADPDFDLENTVGFAKLVMQQDAVASEMNQRGMHSIRFDHGVLMPEENYVHEFDQWQRVKMGRANTGKPET